MAWECPVDRAVLHVNTDACILEVVGEDGEPASRGTEGRVIVTNLYNSTMPFIRYDLHDRGVMLSADRDPCACGSRAQRMAVLQGRDDDFVHLPDGRRVSPRLIATAVNRAFQGLTPLGAFDSHFRRFQVIQDASDHITVRIIPEPGRDVEFEPVITEVMERIGVGLACTVEIVDELPIEPSGKFKKVIRDIQGGRRDSGDALNERYGGLAQRR
jgi:phenylacetate-CoA ligase